MATASPAPNPKGCDLTQACPVCMERYRDPRLLQCAHHFCKVCLEEIADRHPQGSVPCPTCRHVTPIEGDTSVSNLPIYRVINNFIGNANAAIAANLNSKLDITNCDGCKDKLVQATKVCFCCNISLCDSCHNQVHANFSGYQGHETFPMSEHIFCESHKKNFNVFFCSICEKMCCPVSAIQDHKEHDSYPLEKKTDVLRQALQNIIHSMKQSAEENMASGNIHSMLNKAKNMQSDFKATMDGLKTAIKQLEKKAFQVEEEVNSKLSAEIKHLEMMSCDMDDYADLREKLKNHMSYLVEVASNQELFGRHKDLPKYDPEFYKQLICKPEIELPVLGDTLSDVTAQLEKSSKQLNIAFEKNHVHTTGAPLTNLKNVAKYNVGNYIYGMAVDSVRERLVVRRNDTTAPITVYDVQGQQLQVLGKDVEGIAGNSDQGIAIDNKRDLYIVPMGDGSLLSMDMNGTVVDRIKLIQNKLYGAAYCETDFYVTSSTNPDQVYLIDPNTKQKVASFSPNTTFNCPINVHSCQFTSGGVTKPVIVVSDCNNHCIKVLDMSGHLLHTYGKEGEEGQGDGELSYAWGVCTDPGGRIIVGDHYNNRVVSFWSEGDKGKFETLVSKDIFSGYICPILACDPVTRRMFVASCLKPDVLVYEG